MHSQTLVPFYQYIKWLGINPWNAAGIDITGENISPYSRPTRNNREACVCLLQSPWLASAKTWTRDDLIETLNVAERAFIDYARFYPVPYGISDEYHRYKLNANYSNSTFKVPSISPNYGCCGDLTFGTPTLTLLESDVSLVKTIEDTLQQTFTLTVSVPENTNAGDIRVYFSGSEYTPDNFNDHTYEIRPLQVTVDSNANIATIQGEAYFFVDPANTIESETCLAFESETFVDSVDIYVESIDTNAAGAFIYDANCGTDCENSELNLCAKTKVVGGCFYGVPTPINSSNNPTSFKPGIHSVKINYQTGNSLINGFVRDNLAKTIFKLAVGLSVCVKDYCECSTCTQKKFEYFRSVPKEVIARDAPPAGSDNDYQYVLLITKEIMNKLGGSAPPNYGVLQALRDIRNMRCNTIEGSFL